MKKILITTWSSYKIDEISDCSYFGKIARKYRIFKNKKEENYGKRC